ncbi:MAG: hypothetical protein WCD52_05270 [Xanthobacteraceae bacterium]
MAASSAAKRRARRSRHAASVIPPFRIGAAGKMRAHDAGNGRGFAKSGGVFARAADRRGKRRRQHPHMNLDALSGAGQHRRSDIAVRQQANRRFE